LLDINFTLSFNKLQLKNATMI